MKRFLSGNQAVAQGAWENGVAVAAAYPGTPSTEILEALGPMPDVYVEWATNEKVALDVAVGAAYAGRRAMTAMKHVGLNVAADSLFYVAMTGMEAGLVIVTADDPAMHSSQNEQDSRQYAKFTRLPCLEPSDSQEAYELVRRAFELSEQFDTPVLLRLTTRVSHSSGVVDIEGERVVPPLPSSTYKINVPKYVMMPGNARPRHVLVEERLHRLAEFSETFAENRVEWGDRVLGIVTDGIAYQYAREVFPDASVCKLGMVYPLPAGLLRDFASRVQRLIVLEELDPFIEEGLHLLGIPAEGKSIFPLCGELDQEIVRTRAVAAGLLPQSEPPVSAGVEKNLPIRPPVLCPGCPHRGVFYTLAKLKLVVNGDIGCYTLGCLPPLRALHTCGCMGASIGVAHGASKTGIEGRNVAIIGDSTFFHTGMPALVNVAYNRGNAITIIVDNRVTAMTGHQDNPGTGKTLQGADTVSLDFETLVHAMGIQHVYTVDPYRLEDVEEALQQCLKMDEPSVVISRRECALMPQIRARYRPLHVHQDKCVACGLCMRVGCPALQQGPNVYAKTGKQKTEVNALLCTGCEICAQVCSQQAIGLPEHTAEGG